MQEVSVIIPNFNGMAYLDGVLAGLECQTESNFDVILVDNGSNDGSCAFCCCKVSMGPSDRTAGEFRIL